MGDKVKESIEELMFALEYDSWSVQKKTAKALVKIGRPAVKPLIAALRSRAWIVREGAAEVTPTILSYLQPLRDWSVQKKAAEILVEILVKIGKPAIEPLIAALRDGDFSVGAGAAEALEKIDPNWPKSEAAERQVPEFIAAMGDRVWIVRQRAAEALGRIGDPKAAEPLIAALRDGDSRVRKEAAESLEKIDLDWPKSEVAERQVPEFIGALGDGSSGVREGAAEALVKIDPDWPKSEATKRQVPKFIAALRDGDLGVSNQAAWALGKIGDFRAVGALTSALRDEQDENFRKDIRGHLKKIKGLQAPLLKLYHLLLCTKCRLRAERKKERVILLDSLKFLRRTFHYPVLESYPKVIPM